MHQRGLIVALLAALAAAPGCGESADAQPAPLCTDEVGCPEGAECIDGVRCERVGDGPFPSDPPRGASSIEPSEILPRPMQAADGGLPEGGIARLDGGGDIPGDDAGRSGFDAGRWDFDSGTPPRPGCDACVE